MKQAKKWILLLALCFVLFVMWTRQGGVENEKIKLELEKNKNELEKIKQELESSGEEQSSSDLERNLELELKNYENKVRY